MFKNKSSIILVTLSLVRVEFVKYIISPFETNTGNQRNYSKRLMWNLCKLNYAVSTLCSDTTNLITALLSQFTDQNLH